MHCPDIWETIAQFVPDIVSFYRIASVCRAARTILEPLSQKLLRFISAALVAPQRHCVYSDPKNYEVWCELHCSGTRLQFWSVPYTVRYVKAFNSLFTNAHKSLMIAAFSDKKGGFVLEAITASYNLSLRKERSLRKRLRETTKQPGYYDSENYCTTSLEKCCDRTT